LKTNITENEICKFIWRDTIATYNPITKELNFDVDNFGVVPFENYPNDMLEFINWILNCEQHKKDKTVWDLNTNTYKKVQLYTIELY